MNDPDDPNDPYGDKWEGNKCLEALNCSPPLGRGISWSFEADSWINLDYEKTPNEKRNEDTSK